MLRAPRGPMSPCQDIMANCSAEMQRGQGVSTQMFSKDMLPIKAAVAEHFGVFNRYYSSVPSASTPNHLFAQSGTSCGITSNSNYTECGTVSYVNLRLYTPGYRVPDSACT